MFSLLLYISLHLISYLSSTLFTQLVPRPLFLHSANSPTSISSFVFLLPPLSFHQSLALVFLPSSTHTHHHYLILPPPITSLITLHFLPGPCSSPYFSPGSLHFSSPPSLSCHFPPPISSSHYHLLPSPSLSRRRFSSFTLCSSFSVLPSLPFLPRRDFCQALPHHCLEALVSPSGSSQAGLMRCKISFVSVLAIFPLSVSHFTSPLSLFPTRRQISVSR